MSGTFWTEGVAVFTESQDTAIKERWHFPSSKSAGRKRILSNPGITKQRWEFVIFVCLSKNRNGNLRDPFIPFRRSMSGPSVICTLHHHSSLTRNGFSTKNPHFILFKDAFLERYDAARINTNKNPTEKLCYFIFFSLPWGSPQSHDPGFASHNYSHCSPVSSRAAGHARGHPAASPPPTQPSIFLLKPPSPRSTRWPRSSAAVND